MNKILILLILSFGLIGNSYAQICNEDSNVQNRNGVVFLPNKTKSYSGQNLCIYDNGQYKVKGEFTEGLKDGKWTYWAKNGIKKTEETYELGNIQTKTIFSSKHYQKLETIVFADDSKSEFKKTIWEYHPNGNLSKEQNFAFGEKHGFHLTFYESGQPKEKGEFLMDSPIGIHYRWYQNGQKEFEVKYESKTLIEFWKFWDEDGKLTSEEKWNGDELLSTTEYKYFANGQLKDMSTREEDDSEEWKYIWKYEGERASWYESGQKKQLEFYKDGVLNGKVSAWYENGQIKALGNYKNNKPDGKQSFWRENGQLRGEINFKNGNYFGKMLFWYPSGALEFEADFINKSAVLTFWHENGTKAGTAQMKDDGKVNGIITEWYENGSKRRIGNHIDDLPDGKQTHYYSEYNQKKLVYYCSNGAPFGDVQGWRINGQKYDAGGFKDGNGKLLALHANGNKEVEIYFKDGVQTSSTYWDKNNVKTLDYIYENPGSGFGTTKNIYSEGAIQETSFSPAWQEALGLCSGYEPFEQGTLSIKD